MLTELMLLKSNYPIWVIIILEAILSCYAIALATHSKSLVAEVINVLLAILWLVCAFLNIIDYFGVLNIYF
jgi:hypothetical protein